MNATFDRTAGEARRPETAIWHTLGGEAAARRLQVDPDAGLPADEAIRRADQFGRNEIRERKPHRILRTALAQFQDFMILVLMAAAVLSGLVGDGADAIAILAIVLLNAAVGFLQDFRAERAIAALKQIAAEKALVVRGGLRTQIPAAEVVPGDVILLEAGAVVPADLRLIEAPLLRIAEAPLTGEAAPVEKRTAPLPDPVLPVAERNNMAFKGTVVRHGRGRGIAVATGMDTEFGQIAGMIEAAPAVQTPLQRRLASFGRELALVVLAISALIFVSGVLRGEPALLMAMTAVSLAVAAIPEALPAVVTVALALGARTMAARNALVRRLSAVEALGSVNWICTDKTGTLTRNEMRVQEICLSRDREPPSAVDPGDPAVRRLFEAMALCNDAGRGQGTALVGDPTDVALREAAAAAGFEKDRLDRTAPRRREFPFDSDRKRMTTIHESPGGGFVAVTKGAPETVLDRCVALGGEAGPVGFERAPMLALAAAMAADGLRVIAVADRQWDALPAVDEPEQIEQGLTLLGLVGLFDPPRPEAEEAVAACKAAGITPVMVTGDHLLTARAIALAVGIAGPGDDVLTGRELRDLSDTELVQRVERVCVYARVDPAQKIRIVAALQARGAFVAMTGDGVNDGPALARAEIGIAMGGTGTDVARNAASLVLLDDNFATIVAAVAEGRRIFDNIRKFVRYVLTGNSAEIWTIFLAPLLGLPIPLLPIQILWINLVTDGLPGLALAAEPPENAVMQRPPRPPGESVFARGLWQHALWAGLGMAGVTLATQAYAIRIGSSHWQTMVFTVLTLSQMGHVLAVRSERSSLFQQGFLSNRPLLTAVLLTLALQLATIYVPGLNPILRTAPLSAGELSACLGLSSLVFVAVEIEKYGKRHAPLPRGSSGEGAGCARAAGERGGAPAASPENPSATRICRRESDTFLPRAKKSRRHS